MPMLVHTLHYSRLEKNDYIYRLPPKKDCHVYFARSTYRYAYVRQKKQVNCNYETKRRNEDRGK